MIELAVRNRTPIPDKILNAPELQLGLSLYYSGFWDLTTCRPEAGPIPWTAIEMYCHSYELEGAQKEDFHFHITEMDSAYLDYRARKTQAKVEASKPSKGKKK